MINFDDFKKVELRVVEIFEAERVEGSDKLLRLGVSLGEEKRQIIAGIGKKYNPEDLVRKKIVVVANLEPRTLMGLESQGMVLAATNEKEEPILISPIEEVPAGSSLR